MPPMVLLDATPLRGTGCDQVAATYVRGLIGEFGRDLDPTRPRLLIDASTAAPPGFVAHRLPHKPGGVRRAVHRGPREVTVPEAAVADLVHLTSTADLSAPRQVSSCHDLIPLRFPAVTVGVTSAVARRRYNRFLERLRWARLVMVPTHPAARDLVELLAIPEQRVRVIPFGAPALTDPAPPADPPTMLVVANREPHTNAALAVRALACTNPHHAARLVIVGLDDRRRRDRLERLAVALGVGDRTVVAASPDPVWMSDLRRTATMAMVPSRAEGASVPALAAMSAGLPIVASDIPELAEQLRAAGLRVPGFAAASWGEALDGVLEDAALRTGLAQRSHARARALSWHECARQVRACYAEAIDG